MKLNRTPTEVFNEQMFLRTEAGGYLILDVVYRGKDEPKITLSSKAPLDSPQAQFNDTTFDFGPFLPATSQWILPGDPEQELRGFPTWEEYVEHPHLGLVTLLSSLARSAARHFEFRSSRA